MQLKETAELIRALNPTIQGYQRSIARVVTPYFVATVVFFLTMFDTGFPEFVSIEVIRYGGIVNPNSGTYEGGFEISNFQSVGLFILSLALFYGFVRFGYHYYQGYNLITTLQATIQNQFEPTVRQNASSEAKARAAAQAKDLQRILSQVCKENYLIQAMIALRKTDNGLDPSGNSVYRWVTIGMSAALISIFVFFMGFSQYMVVVFLDSVFPPLSWLVAAVFIVFYLMFAIGITFDWRAMAATKLTGSPFYLVFNLWFLGLVALNIWGLLVALGDTGQFALTGSLSTENKFDIEKTLFRPYFLFLDLLPGVVPE